MSTHTFPNEAGPHVVPDQRLQEQAMSVPATASGYYAHSNSFSAGGGFATPLHEGLIQAPVQHAMHAGFSTYGRDAVHQQPPALDFNGFILYASGRPVPQELMRVPTGTSIAEPGSILDDESGRTYHNHHTGRYFLPNDPAEQDRLDLQHNLIWLLMDRRLYHAPVQSPKNVLDIATGTGIWAIKFAKMHPEATVTGTDLSLIQPENAPFNVSFIKEDSEKDEWVFSHSFDFVFLRMVVTCFDDHRTIIKKAFDHLRPGGWIELNDTVFELLCTDGSAEGTNVKRWAELLVEAGKATGRDFRNPKMYKQWLQENGFVDVVEEIIPIPMSPWPSDPKFKDVGRWELMNAVKGLRSLSWRLFRNIGMAAQEIEEWVKLVQADFHDPSIHGFFPFYVVYGRKPYPGELGEHHTVERVHVF